MHESISMIQTIRVLSATQYCYKNQVMHESISMIQTIRILRLHNIVIRIKLYTKV